MRGLKPLLFTGLAVATLAGGCVDSRRNNTPDDDDNDDDDSALLGDDDTVGDDDDTVGDDDDDTVGDDDDDDTMPADAIPTSSMTLSEAAELCLPVPVECPDVNPDENPNGDQVCTNFNNLVFATRDAFAILIGDYYGVSVTVDEILVGDHDDLLMTLAADTNYNTSGTFIQDNDVVRLYPGQITRAQASQYPGGPASLSCTSDLQTDNGPVANAASAIVAGTPAASVAEFNSCPSPSISGPCLFLYAAGFHELRQEFTIYIDGFMGRVWELDDEADNLDSYTSGTPGDSSVTYLSAT